MKYEKDILKLRQEGKTYNEICSILGCSKGIVSYHCGPNQKIKHKERAKKNKIKNGWIHNFNKKFSRFQTRSKNIYKKRKYKTNWFQRLESKLDNFNRGNSIKMLLKDILKLIGKNPKCYLTGRYIDLTKTHDYHFDHKIPISRGGDNSINNFGLACRQANVSKSDMTHAEFISFCKEVLEYNEYIVIKR